MIKEVSRYCDDVQALGLFRFPPLWSSSHRHVMYSLFLFFLSLIPSQSSSFFTHTLSHPQVRSPHSPIPPFENSKISNNHDQAASSSCFLLVFAHLSIGASTSSSARGVSYTGARRAGFESYVPASAHRDLQQRHSRRRRKGCSAEVARAH